MSRIDTVSAEVFKFSELSNEAKEKALEKLWDLNVDYDWWDGVYDDAVQVSERLGIEIDARIDRSPAIYFSGFSSQGDGACFEGAYSYKKGSAKATRNYAPQDTELRRIAQELQEIQAKNSYQLRAIVKQRGHYNHSGCTEIWVSRNDDKEMTADAEEDLKQLLREFMDWIYSQLEKNYDYLTSRKAVIETIEVNEYEFTKLGNMY